MYKLKNFNLEIKGKNQLDTYRSFVRGEITRKEAYPTMRESAINLKGSMIELVVQQIAAGILLNKLSKEGFA